MVREYRVGDRVRPRQAKKGDTSIYIIGYEEDTFITGEATGETLYGERKYKYPIVNLDSGAVRTSYRCLTELRIDFELVEEQTSKEIIHGLSKLAGDYGLIDWLELYGYTLEDWMEAANVLGVSLYPDKITK